MHRRLFALLLALPSCYPASFTEIPELTGRVTTPTGAPVPDATITVTPTRTPFASPPVTLRTDAAGRFRHPAQTFWSLTPVLPADALAPTFTATASQADARSAPFPVGGGVMQKRPLGLGPVDRLDLGDVPLNLAPPQPPPAAK